MLLISVLLDTIVFGFCLIVRAACLLDLFRWSVIFAASSEWPAEWYCIWWLALLVPLCEKAE